jgi:hypothetical protein
MARMTEAEQQDKQYRELAAAIADQAQAIADGTGSGPLYARVQLLKSNVALLEAWTPDDRSGMAPAAQDEQETPAVYLGTDEEGWDEWLVPGDGHTPGQEH